MPRLERTPSLALQQPKPDGPALWRLHFTERAMLKIDVRGLATIRDHLNDLQGKHIPFATALALTRTAQDVRKAEIEEMKRSFDRPTRWTLNSLFIKPATKANLTALVWLKDAGSGTPATKYLAPEIYGGARRLKGFERMLYRKGLLAPGWMAVPGEAARMDAFGNMRSGQIVQILSALSAFGEQGYTANRSLAATRGKSARAKRMAAARQQYFVGSPGGGRLPRGVWQRFGVGRASVVKPVLIFVRGPRYQKRFDFFGVAERTIARVFGPHFSRALAEAT